MNEAKIQELKKLATEVRLGILEGVHAAASGHPGGSLSIADIMSYLYFSEMKVDPANPKWKERDRFVLSKGHGAGCLDVGRQTGEVFGPQAFVIADDAEHHTGQHTDEGQRIKRAGDRQALVLTEAGDIVF